jgi:hypothetical protein
MKKFQVTTEGENRVYQAAHEAILITAIGAAIIGFAFGLLV